MTITEFITKAIEGGWNPTEEPDALVHEGEAYFYSAEYPEEGGFSVSVEKMLLDPEAWKAVGKVEGWGMFIDCKKCHSYNNWQKLSCPSCGSDDIVLRTDGVGGPVYLMHRMIDNLSDGHAIEEYLATL